MDPLDSKIKDYLERSRDSRFSSKDLAEAETEIVPEEFILKAKNLFRKPSLKKQKIWNGVWALLAAASFAGSFLVPRYFFQFLAVFLFFGFRWIVGERAARTQILIYKALKENQETLPKSRDLHHPESHL